MRWRVAGVPVTVDPFFLIGLVLVWSWAGGGRAGLYAAVFVGVFTLLHELGHALTARRFGADSAITLNLLVGWASYASARQG
jgi:stage IV sporulation protein FB